ncbi:MAG TPA: CHAT domain-containing protein [Verrucomicrobiota bacterium]|nr:hypothetical protein [Verrucomicrobiales bacterium]HRI12325.1 CHAT domain-containing protein [Verrucomicrobiota bacterium]
MSTAPKRSRISNLICIGFALTGLAALIAFLLYKASTRPVSPITAEVLHNAAVARGDDGSDSRLNLVKTAYEGRLHDLGPVHTNTLSSLRAYCEALLESGKASDHLPLFTDLLTTTIRLYPENSEPALIANSLLLDAQAQAVSRTQEKQQIDQVLTDFGINIGVDKLKTMSQLEVLTLLQSTPAGAALLQQADFNRQETVEYALSALSNNPSLQAIVELANKRAIDSLQQRGYSAEESQRLLSEYTNALQASLVVPVPGESLLDYQRRLEASKRSDQGNPVSPQLRTNPFTRPSIPADPRNVDRRLLEETSRLDPKAFERISSAGLAGSYLRNPRDFCEAQLREINKSFEAGALPGHITSFKRLEIPATALTNAQTMAQIVASLKGLVMDRETRMQRAIAQSSDPAVAKWRADLWKLTAELARLQVDALDVRLPGPVGSRASQAAFHPAPFYEAYIKTKTQVESIRQLAAGLTDSAQYGMVDLSKIASALPSATVIVDFARYTPDRGGTNLLYDYYGAAILARNRLWWVPLGEAEVIDGRIRKWTSLFAAKDQPKEFKALSVELYKNLWGPVAAVLPKETTQVIISPDGELNRLSFAALFDGQSFLAEQFTIRTVATSRELLGPPPTQSQERTMSLWGDIPYGKRDADGRGITGLNFQPLPHTKNEVAAIEKIGRAHGYTVSANLGGRASETSFSRLSSPRLLHVATHGVVIPMPKATGTNLMPALARHLRDEMDRELLPFRAALGFSGGNQGLDSWTTSGVAQPGDDGLLTGFEAAQLNLRSTELVTLSACDSGSGPISPGEGMYSLRRGFHLAGARNVVASLWLVEDSYASQFFEKYYSKLFAGKEPALALRELQATELKRLSTGGDAEFRNAVNLVGPFVISGTGIR